MPQAQVYSRAGQVANDYSSDRSEVCMVTIVTVIMTCAVVTFADLARPYSRVQSIVETAVSQLTLVQTGSGQGC